MAAGKMQSVERRNSGEELFIFRAKGRVSSMDMACATAILPKRWDSTQVATITSFIT
jgi:hypothetical protein